MKKILLIIFFVNLNCTNQEQVKWINILIHGTFGLRAYLNFGTFVRIFQDKIDYSDYDIGVNAMRTNPGFYMLQPMQEIGLQKVTDKNLGPYIFAQIFGQIANGCNTNSGQDLYYTYGWSGLISYKKRVKESYKLYEALKQEHEKLISQYNCPIKYRIIGYSNGGNIGLHLANAYNDASVEKGNFFIDELIMIGTPAHRCNKCLIYCDLFKKIYNIYSKSDYIQNLDIFSPCGYFSHRDFKDMQLEKLIQIEVQVAKSRPKNKCQCYCSAFGCCAMHNTLNYSPGHCELWFFGWTHRHYRPKFPLYPLPIAVFIPYIKECIRKHCPEAHNIKFRITPDRSLCAIRDKKDKCKKTINFDFIHSQELEKLQNKALDMCPDLNFCQLTEFNCKPKITRFICHKHHMHIKCALPATDIFCTSSKFEDKI